MHAISLLVDHGFGVLEQDVGRSINGKPAKTP